MESNAHFDIVTRGDLFVLRWRAPSVEALMLLRERLPEAHEAAARPLFYLGLIPGDQAKPDQATRDEMVETMAATARCLEETRMVILGEGFQATILRGVITLATLLAGDRTGPLHCDKSIRAALEVYARTRSVEVEELCALLVDEGIASREELG